jgi:hypothetical protein
MAKSFDPYAHKLVHKDGPHIAERHPHPTSAPHPRGGLDKMGRHDEVQAPQHPENHRDVSPRHPGDTSNRYHNDVGEKWTRGFGDPYPHFDHSDKAPRFNASDGNTWRKNPSDTDGKQDGERHGSDQHRFQAKRRPKG